MTDEQRARFGAGLACGAVVGQLVLGRVARDSLVIGAFGAGALPRVALVTALVTAVVTALAAQATVRFGPARTGTVGIALNVLCFLVEAALVTHAPRLAAMVVHLHTGALSGPLVSLCWSVVSERFDPHSAKRAIGRISAAGSVGAAVGGAAGFGLGHGGPIPVLACLVAMNGLAVAGIFVLGCSPVATRSEGAERTLVESIALLGRVRYLRHLGELILLVGMLESILDYLLGARVAALASPLRIFGAFHLSIAIVSVVALAVANRPALRTLGLGGTLSLLPASIVTVAAVGAACPGFAIALAGRSAYGVLRASLFRSAYEILFTPLEPDDKRGVKVLIDVGFDRAGTALGSVIAILALAISGAQAGQVLYGVLVVLGLGAIVVTRRLQHGYVETLEHSLRQRTLDAGSLPLIDATTRLAVTRTQTKLAREQLLREIAAFEAGGVAAGATAQPPSHHPLALGLAMGALGTEDAALRGTAIEYLQQVLPKPLWARLRALFPRSHSGGPSRPEPSAVPPRSTASI